MQEILGNAIKLTKGDTLKMTIELTKDGEAYTPVQGDALRFALSKGFVGEFGYKLITTKEISTEDMTVTLTAEETDALPCRTYNYDIQLTHADGSVDTVILSTLTITEEVE